MQQFFAQVHCSTPCRYLLKASAPKDDLFEIHPGYSEIGTMEPQELRQHLLVTRDFDNATLVQRSYTVKLHLFSGEANL